MPKKENKENNNLTHRQEMFCKNFIETKNKRHSAMMAGYPKKTAHIEANRLMKNPKIIQELDRLQEIEDNKIVYTKARDVLNKYIDIAFSDITDFVEFGTKNINGINRSYVNLEDSNNVDGSIINEVSQGKDGTKIKLADRMKALEFLADYFKMNHYKNEKLDLDKQRLKHETESDENIQDNIKSFLEATRSSKEELNELFEDDIEDGDTTD